MQQAPASLYCALRRSAPLHGLKSPLGSSALKHTQHLNSSICEVGEKGQWRVRE